VSQGKSLHQTGNLLGAAALPERAVGAPACRRSRRHGWCCRESFDRGRDNRPGTPWLQERLQRSCACRRGDGSDGHGAPAGTLRIPASPMTSCLARVTANQVSKSKVKEEAAVLLPFFARSSRLLLLAASASVLFPFRQHRFTGVLGPSQDLDSTPAPSNSLSTLTIVTTNSSFIDQALDAEQR
jgi:hypothetical protein